MNRLSYSDAMSQAYGLIAPVGIGFTGFAERIHRNRKWMLVVRLLQRGYSEEWIKSSLGGGL